jgi:hypothetical protein
MFVLWDTDLCPKLSVELLVPMFVLWDTDLCPEPHYCADRDRVCTYVCVVGHRSVSENLSRGRSWPSAPSPTFEAL